MGPMYKERCGDTLRRSFLVLFNKLVSNAAD
jgi:hypothetical protein